MSIEKRACHRFQGSLGINGTRHSVQLHIKGLQTLGCSAVQDAIDIQVLTDLRHGEGQALALRFAARCPLSFP